uniref:F-box only protein 15 isoform X2 n=1 Tax=Geotrypetes seraphini TaxID=260995 RepID=A0A6P8Q4S6_GEOSA|nr:F-box only protein 15 isoform X2 [Geotrypetes seraphini]
MEFSEAGEVPSSLCEEPLAMELEISPEASAVMTPENAPMEVCLTKAGCAVEGSLVRASMAAGRRWEQQQHRAGLENAVKAKQRLSSTQSHRKYKLSAESTTSCAAKCRTFGIHKVMKNPSSVQSASLESLPSEILLKIFAHLDALSLLYTGCMNKRFFYLANDNFIWYKIYSGLSSFKNSHWKPKEVEDTVNLLSVASIQEKEQGYWKKAYIAKQIATSKNGITLLLKPINMYTGLPINIKEAVKSVGLKWTITFKDKIGKEFAIDQKEVTFNDTSVTVFWYGSVWPQLRLQTSLQIYGVMPVLLNCSKTFSKSGLWRRSLIVKYDLMDLESNSTMIGCDRMVKLFRLNPGLLLGLWRSGSEIAFVMAAFHYHQLIEWSILDSADNTITLPPHQPNLDDVDPNYGLHGYRLHIDIHNGGRTFMCGTFRNLFCKKDYIQNGLIRLNVISIKNPSQHKPLAGKIGLLWKTDAFEGNVQNCCIMDVTLLEEAWKRFWCVSTPVGMQTSTRTDGLFDYVGQKFVIDYCDSMGKIHTELLWMEETEEYYIINLVLYLSLEKVNEWFGTNYSSD